MDRHFSPKIDPPKALRLPAPRNPHTRTLVVGDVHGCVRELEGLLEHAGFRRGLDRLVFAGDLLDRGPDSVGVVRYAMELGAHAVLGNHEEKHLRYRRHALRALSDPTYKVPMWKPHPTVHESLRSSEWAWLGTLPLTLWLRDDIVVVHGGFSEDSTPENPDLNSCRIRYVDAKNGSAKGSINGFAQPQGTVFWTRAYRGGENGNVSVLFGHEPFQEPQWNGQTLFWTLGLDTGCCYGRKLTGYWVEEHSLVSIRSSEMPYSGPAWNDGYDPKLDPAISRFTSASFGRAKPL